jgi:hypothetical protein
MTSKAIHKQPIIPKSWANMASGMEGKKVHPYALETAYQRLKHFVYV